MITLIAESVEDQISWGRVIARSTDLYGKRSRHWSTADPIHFLIYSKRGKLYRAPPEEAEVIEEVLEAEETTGDAADEADLDINDEEGAPARAKDGALC